MIYKECIGDNEPTEYHSIILLPIKENSITQPLCYRIVENHVSTSKSFTFKSSRGFCGYVLSFPVSHEDHYTAKSFISQLIEKKRRKKLKQEIDSIFQKYYNDHKLMEEEQPAVNLVDVSDCTAFQDRYALSSSALLCSIAKCFELYADRFVLTYAEEIGRVEQVEDETFLNPQQQFMEEGDKIATKAKMQRLKTIDSGNEKLRKVHIHSEVHIEMTSTYQHCKSNMDSSKSGDNSYATNTHSSPHTNTKNLTPSQLLFIINGYYSIFSSKFKVSTPDGTLIGTISSSFSFHIHRLTILVKNKILKTKYIISNKHTEVSRAFQIVKKGRRFNKGRRKYKDTCGSIIKQSSGFMNELVAPLDNVVIDFPENCDPYDQVLLFSAALLVECKM